MDIERIAQVRDAILQAMREQGYSKKFMRDIRGCYRTIAKFGGREDILSYEDFFLQVVVHKFAPSTIVDKRCCLAKYWYFEKNGELPPPGSQAGFLKKNPYSSLSPEFKCVVDTYQRCRLKMGIAPATISSRRYSLVKFLSYCMVRKVIRINDISEQIVREYYDVNAFGTSSLTQILAEAFGLVSQEYSHAREIRSYLPRIKPSRKPYDALDEAEALAVKRFIDTMEQSCTLRDTAIARIIYHLGIRRGDVANLKISDVNFVNSRISFVQAKTLVRQELPLRPVVGNAILRYLKEERPETSLDSLFLTSHLGHVKPITPSSVNDVMDKVLRKSGVRLKQGRKGAHIFRHNLANKLLKAGNDSLEITAVMGHLSPESINAYLSADEIALKECARDISQYPLNAKQFLKYQ